MSLQSRKMFVPMIGRDYCVTDSEQKDIARKHGLSIDDVRSILPSVDASQLKTAGRVKRAIDEAMKKSVMTRCQGALANGAEISRTQK
jgi:hypothetical protein